MSCQMGLWGGVHSDLRLFIFPSFSVYPAAIPLTPTSAGLAQDKHALLDVTPSAIERLNYVQYYPIVVFFIPESRPALKALRQWLAPASRRSTRRLYAQAQKLRKHSSHLFTGWGGWVSQGRRVGPGLSLLHTLMSPPCSHHPSEWHK